MQTVDVDGRSKSLFEEKVRESVADHLEGQELKDSYNDGGHYYVYYELDIRKYEKAKNALDLEQSGKGYYRDIDKKEIFKYIFNKNTIDKVLIDLMDNGLKVQGGDLIGKTILFAYNHKHAELIVERFNELYPQYGSDFCVLIDYSVNYAQDLINSLEVRDKRPQIAVSVAMLDTGIDVPDILNLVFFKPIESADVLGEADGFEYAHILAA